MPKAQDGQGGRGTEGPVDETGVLVVGAGIAGMAAAVSAREEGADVLLVERAFAGGNAVSHSLLPSKVHLRAAQHLAQYRGWGPLPVAEPGAYLYAAGIHLRHRREEARTAVERHLDEAGVRWLTGDVRFEAPGRARVISAYGPREVRFGSVVICTGSVQHLPPDFPKPDGQRVLIPRDLGALPAVPGTAVVIGTGATGVEVASLLVDYGCRVTLLGRAEHLLGGEDPVLASLLADALARRGVVLGLGFEVRRVDLEVTGRGVRVEATQPGTGGGVGPGGQVTVADAAFVATGRRGDTRDLGVGALSVRTDERGFLTAGPRGETGRAGVYAAGDVTGGLLTANRARAQGQQAGILAARAAGQVRLPEEEESAGPSGEGSEEVRIAVPMAVFARPEYARVGTPPPGRPLGEARILETGSGAFPADPEWQGVPAGLAREPLLYPFIAQGSSAEEGTFDRVRVLVDRDDRIRGASILGEGAAERILLFALAMQEGIAVGRLTSLVPVTPTAGESVRLLGPYRRLQVDHS